MDRPAPLEPVILRDAKAGTLAEVLPERGFNCYRFQARVAGRPVEVIDCLPEFREGRGSPSASGIPILFPFPNRIRDGRFEFAGRQYRLAPGDAFGNAIHGLVLDRAWDVTGVGATADGGQWVEGTLRASTADERLLELWPADFHIAVRYTLAGNVLAASVRVHNPDDKPLPFGFGIHPYFRLPLGDPDNASGSTVVVPAAKRWVLDRCVPTGEIVSVAAQYDLRGGRPLAALELDDVLTDLAFEDECTCRLLDELAGLEVALWFDRFFRELVIYTPPARPAICLEPYTCTTDAVHLDQRGVNAGWRVLEPGATAVGRYVISIRALG